MGDRGRMSEQAAVPFEGFASITRLARRCVVTEKLDGVNAQVYVGDDGTVLAGSRNRWLGLAKTEDHFGFGRWVKEHEEELRSGLGIGRHYGEWWGAGIQRHYGLPEKRFSLFNTARWGETRPACCHIVPVLYDGQFDTRGIDQALDLLATNGSAAAPGFMDPEGIVIFHEPSRTLFKKTLHGDGHKGGGGA